jgi:diguanylate cyclase (GGDEF)-like protein
MDRRRPRLLLRFGIVSFVAVAALGVLLASQLRGNVRQDAIHDAEAIARSTARLAIQPSLRPGDLERPLSPARTDALTRRVRTSLEDTPVVRVKVWNPHGRIVYSDDPSLHGRRFKLGEDLADALAGQASTQVEGADESGDLHRPMVETYVPLRFTVGGPVAGAFEVYIPYDTVVARASAQVRDVTVTLVLGLVVLWAALFRVVFGAARALVRYSDENRRLASEDALTGLANRESFLTEAARVLARRPALAAVVLLDLDRFKDLNDSLGHHAGDGLLQAIGPRLRAAVAPGSVVARLGGDEFAVLLAPLACPADAALTAQAIRTALAEPVEIEGIAVSAEASVGIATYPQDGADVAALLQHADVAMYAAKAGRTGITAYRAADDPSSHERLLVLSELREAIARDELVLHYQPKVALGSGRIAGTEALVRWQHPRRGLLGPDEFVGLAEHTGLIGPLTAWVLSRALRDARRWWDAGLRMGVAVNLSVANLVDPDLPGLVAGLLAETRLPPRALELEITESVLMTEPGRALRTLSVLRSMGVGLAVDDYGTGHSSLAYLHRLPLDTLKIDRSFVAAMGREGGVIVRSTVDLAHNLGLRVVAEGVEDPATAAALRDLGCDLAQGFHYARPVPVAELLQALTAPPFVATVSASAAAPRGRGATSRSPSPSARR